MKAVVYDGVPFQMSVQDIPNPIILDPNDAIVRITLSAICGSDLHVYRGVMGGTPPWTMGHEAVGYICDVGSAVSSLAVGDYVVISDSESNGKLDLRPEPPTYFGNGLPDMLDGLQGQ